MTVSPLPRFLVLFTLLLPHPPSQRPLSSFLFLPTPSRLLSHSHRLALRLSVDHPSPPHRPADDLHAQLDSSHEARKELKESIEQEVSKGRLVPSFSGERLLRSIRSIESLPVPPYGGRLRRKQTYMSSDMAAKLPSTFSSPIGLRTGFRCL